ncbi:hypothetical protein ON010_g6407 [Phytophthora cinnamomi]|nr:hypothetical protein ON010_g6407 [Phytophthora cinnamomi]
MNYQPFAPRKLGNGLGLSRAEGAKSAFHPYEVSKTMEIPRIARYARSHSSYNDTTDALLHLNGAKTDIHSSRPGNAATLPGILSDEIRLKPVDLHKRKLSNDIKVRRREQCSANQARYRNKQREAQVHLEKSVKQLHQEVNNLKRRYRDLSSRERSSQSPWSIVAEVFDLLENCFRSPWCMTSTREMMSHPQTRQILAVLERAFAHDAAMGDLRGVDALMEQLRLYSQCFGDPHLQLKRVESVSAGVMAARVELSVTMTELTLKHIFPNLDGKNGGANGGNLYERFLDQRLKCHGSMTSLFDENSERVVRLETKIDLLSPLLRVVGNVEDVIGVLENTRISLECVISNKNMHCISDYSGGCKHVLFVLK